MKSYDYKSPFELGRIAFALGYPEAGPDYAAFSTDSKMLIGQGWDHEYKRNLVRCLKVHENKEVPKELSWYDNACINTKYFVNKKLFEKALSKGD